MAERKAMKVERYVEAVLEVRAYKRQLREHPELADDRTHKATREQARVAMELAHRDLKGGEVFAARQLIAKREAEAREIRASAS